MNYKPPMDYTSHTLLSHLSWFPRPQSPLTDSSPEAQELRRLRERLALLPHHSPFEGLEVIATLGMGGFGRVELVRHLTFGSHVVLDHWICV